MSTPPLDLYFIVYYDEDGNALDLLVRAHSPIQAVNMWRNHYTEPNEGETGLPEPSIVHRLTDRTSPGPIAWTTGVPGYPAA